MCPARCTSSSGAAASSGRRRASWPRSCGGIAWSASPWAPSPTSTLVALSATKVRSSRLARAFLLANLFGCAGPGGQHPGRPRPGGGCLGSDPRHAACWPPPPRGRGRSMFLQGSRRWAAWCAMRAVTGRPCGRLWSDERQWRRGRTRTPPPTGLNVLVVSISPERVGSRAEPARPGAAARGAGRRADAGVAGRPPGRGVVAPWASRTSNSPPRPASGCGRPTADGRACGLSARRSPAPGAAHGRLARLAAGCGRGPFQQPVGPSGLRRGRADRPPARGAGAPRPRAPRARSRRAEGGRAAGVGEHGGQPGGGRHGRARTCDRLRVIPQAVDPERFHPGPARRVLEGPPEQPARRAHRRRRRPCRSRRRASGPWCGP